MSKFGADGDDTVYGGCGGGVRIITRRCQMSQQIPGDKSILLPFCDALLHLGADNCVESDTVELDRSPTL